MFSAECEENQSPRHGRVKYKTAVNGNPKNDRVDRDHHATADIGCWGGGTAPWALAIAARDATDADRLTTSKRSYLASRLASARSGSAMILFIILSMCAFAAPVAADSFLWITLPFDSQRVTPDPDSGAVLVGIGAFGGDVCSVFTDVNVYVNGRVSGFSYNCATASIYFLADGTGCAPVIQLRGTSFLGTQFSAPIQIYYASANGAVGPCEPDCTRCKAKDAGQGPGKPVDVTTGKVWYDRTDLSLGGPYPISLTRHYDNQQADAPTDLGYGWMHPYDEYVSVVSTFSGGKQVLYHNAVGDRVAFSKVTDADVYRPNFWYHYKLTESAGPTYDVLEYRTHVTRRFNASGQLTQITDRFGKVTTLTYASGLLTTVTDPFTKTLTFAYTGTPSRISTITTSPDSRVFTYGHDGNGNLTSVLYPDGRSWTYEYSDADVHNLTAVRDPFGHIEESFAYTADRATSYAEDAGNNAFSLTYSAGTTTMTDALSRSTTYTWDATNRLVTQISGPGCGCGGNQTKTLTWDIGVNKPNWPNKLTETDGNGNRTKWTYYTYTQDGGGPQYYTLGGIATMVVADNAATPIKRTTTYSYDSSLGPNYSYDLIQVQQESADTAGQFALVKYTLGATSKLPTQIDRVGRVAGVVNTFTTLLTYDAFGNVLTIDGERTDVVDKTTNTFYDAVADADLNRRGMLQTTTDAATNATTFDQYTVYGQARQITDPNNVVTTRVFDAVGRISTSTISGDTFYPAPLATIYTYNADGLLQDLALPRGDVTHSEYDTVHRPTVREQRINATTSGDRLHWTYNIMGFRTSEANERWNGSSYFAWKTTTFVPDVYGRLWKTTPPGGTATEYTERFYDLGGRLWKINDNNHLKDGSQPTTTFGYDQANRLTSVIQRLGAGTATTSYGFDKLDSLTSVIDANLSATSYVFDDFRRLRSQTSPVTGTWTFGNDPAGNRTSQTDANADVENRTFDPINRLLTISYPADSSLNQTLVYDDATAGSYNRRQLSSLTDASGTATFKHERRGLLTLDRRTIGGTPYDLAMSYDDDGNRIGMTYPDGRVTTTTVDLLGQVTDLKATIGGVADQPVVTNIAYRPLGPLTDLLYGNGLSESRDYDQRYRPIGIYSGGSVLARQIGYDKEINPIVITDLVNSTNSRTFTYDAMYRIGGSTGPFGIGTYSIDPAGNILTLTEGGVTTTYNYNAASHQWLTSTTGAPILTFNYNNNKNATSDSVHTYQYGKNRRLTQVDSGVTATYVYRADGHRVQKATATGTTRFIYLPEGQLAAELNVGANQWTDYMWLGWRLVGRITPTAGELELGSASNSLRVDKNTGNPRLTWGFDGFAQTDMRRDTSFSFLGGSLLAACGVTPPYTDATASGTNYAYKALGCASEKIEFVVTDHLDTPTRMTDMAAALVWNRELRPFGATQSEAGAGPPFLFPGQYRDSDSGLFDNWNRTYSTIGRYYQADPVGIRGDMNLYAYARDNPILMVDPDGLLASGPCRAKLGKLMATNKVAAIDFVQDVLADCCKTPSVSRMFPAGKPMNDCSGQRNSNYGGTQIIGGSVVGTCLYSPAFGDVDDLVDTIGHEGSHQYAPGVDPDDKAGIHPAAGGRATACWPGFGCPCAHCP